MSRRPIVQERTVAASQEEVFRAWSDPAALADWMRPSEGMAPATVEVDFRVGGRFRIVMHGERDYVQEGEYLEIDPPRRLVFTWVSAFLPDEEAHTRVTVTLEPDGAGTRIRLVHDQLPEGDAYDGHVEGWARILACARAWLEKEET